MKTNSSSVRDDYSFPPPTPLPPPHPDAINLTVFALLCSFNQPRSISVHAEHILLITFATCTESLHSLPVPAPASLLSPPTLLTACFCTSLWDFRSWQPQKIKSLSSAVAELRELRPHLVELHFCGRYVPVCKCVYRTPCVCVHELYKQINCLFVATICGNFVICALVLPLPLRERWHHLCLFSVLFEGGCWHASCTTWLTP